ncbi:hypothetical protein E6O75_ATG11414 [Venturia nashicola]|uniref:Mediator of RNA polymerase II transcription subunit 8 n=1 Tax=Venturia nashicola TaxID=86259 RepID=A0A4Z1NLC1_9PEZI|nr:hypothetical protein E6O75_ATG11414 [Venturia nashicola]
MSKPKKPDSAAFTIASDKDEDDHKTIEALRASFTRLHAGIDMFSQRDFLIQDPNAIENAEGTGMPSWPAIYHATNGIKTNIIHTARLITKNETFLSEAHIHPNTTWPIERTHLIDELLRRQPDFETQAWMNEALALGQGQQEEGEGEDEMTSKQWEELWEFADYQHNVKAREIYAGQEVGDDEGEDEEDGEDEEEEEEEVTQVVAGEKGKGVVVSGGVGMSLEDVLRYMHSGGTLMVGGPPPMG